MTTSADPDKVPSGPDAHYLTHTARSYGWTVTAHPDATVRLSLPDRSMHLRFTPDGAFRHATATGPDHTDHRLDLRQVVDVLERHGSAKPPAPRA
ncbi:hypothetical protein [Yinghuangia soli]|uniref:Uncharacterized protein n=1 Tax=Yinghuangia soli TaxID=2908204 RepID=A0AA41TZ84_9ACTN|nr:hypothetical protein [Yinghuangia soli]MCF2527236.1 hypothetical protein [Yinghuangia soli]